MKNSLKGAPSARLTLCAETAADLMTPNPVSIGADAPVKEAVAFLTDKGFSAAPVIDDAGRPIGVLSRADILVHDREKAEYLPTVPEYYEKTELTARSGENLPSGFQVENVDRTWVRDIMTPVVFSVAPDTPVRRVVAEMLALRVHRLFVVGSDGVLVGVISALDVLRHLGLDESFIPSSAPGVATAGCEPLYCES
jgi:CBS-domain-containing membrane protein